MSDTLFHGRRFRTFNVLDDFNREALAIEVDLDLPAVRIIRVLARIADQRGYPHRLRCDNGPELVSIALAGWADDHGVELDFIKPGKPTQNSYVERFNRTYRDESLDLYLFRTLTEVRDLTASWIRKYNEERPHDSLGDLTPAEYLAGKSTVESSNYAWSKQRDTYIQVRPIFVRLIVAVFPLFLGWIAYSMTLSVVSCKSIRCYSSANAIVD